MWRAAKCTNSAYKYTHLCPAENHPGTLKVTQSVNKSHGLYRGSAQNKFQTRNLGGRVVGHWVLLHYCCHNHYKKSQILSSSRQYFVTNATALLAPLPCRRVAGISPPVAACLLLKPAAVPPPGKRRRIQQRLCCTAPACLVPSS